MFKLKPETKAKSKPERSNYHHGDLATALLVAVDELASQFGLEAVSLRAAAKRVGVSPAAAFRHYADKRALLTAFAATGLRRMAQAMVDGRQSAIDEDRDPFLAVGLAYVRFSLQHPAHYQVMWRQELINAQDEEYSAAAQSLGAHLTAGFGGTIEDAEPNSFSAQEMLAWSSVHGLSSLMIDGPVARGMTLDAKLTLAQEMLHSMQKSMQVDTLDENAKL